MKEQEYLKTIAKDERLMLTFLLRGEHFAVEAIYIKEILEFLDASRIPGTSEYIKGLINLRGNIVPVADLAQKFTLGYDTGKKGSIVILEYSNHQLGILIERIAGLIRPQEEEIKMIDLNIPARLSFSNIKGMINTPQQSFFILDIEELFNDIFAE